MTKTKSTKRALLLSALSLLMCVSMLIGSTFAWFTDSAVSGSNIIQSGTLDVELLDANGASLEGQMIKWAAFDGRDQDKIFWEPGCTYETEPFTVKNAGNLALKFSLVVNGITGNAKLLEVIDFTCIAENVTYTQNFGGFDIVTTGDADLLSGEFVLEPGQSIDGIVLTGHMDEYAGNEYQGLTIENISVSVIATQVPFEQDSIDGMYDANANVYTASTTEEAQALIYSVDDGAIIQLTAGNYDKLMLQSAYVGEARTIKNLTIKGAAGVNVAGIEVGNKTTLNNVVIDSINFTGEYDGFQCNVGDAAVDGLTINKCTMTDDGTAQFVSIKTPSPKNVKITNCTVDGAQRLITMVPSNNVTITGNTMKNLTVHGILLDNSGGRYHTGTIVIADNEYDRGAGECFIRIANLDETNTLIIKDNTVTNYMAGTSEIPHEDTYIKITTANGEIDIMGNTATDASALGGHPVRGDLYVSVNGERYVQLVPRS